MRRDRKSKIRRERIVMVASSALVMGALTMTGIYMKGQSEQNADDGYSIDFSTLEDSIDNKVQEIVQNQVEYEGNLAAGLPDDLLEDEFIGEDDLDYDPVGSTLVQIPGLTDDIPETESIIELPESEEETKNENDLPQNLDTVQDSDTLQSEDTQQTSEGKQLDFRQEQGLIRPVSGEILMHYSMDSSIYFKTLDQYKYNPAVIIAAAEGEEAAMCADGRVISIYEDPQIGQAVTVDLGNGYVVTYGQLQDIKVSEGSYIDRGAILASVAAPTKYYSVEGTNLYFQMKKDGQPVNPEDLFQ